jgi:hypothetical protein
MAPAEAFNIRRYERLLMRGQHRASGTDLGYLHGRAGPA